MDELVQLLPSPSSLGSKLARAKSEYAAEVDKAAASGAGADGSSPAVPDYHSVPDYRLLSWPKGYALQLISKECKLPNGPARAAAMWAEGASLAAAASPTRQTAFSKTYQAKFDRALVLATGVDAGMDAMITLLCAVARTIKDWDKGQKEVAQEEEGEEEEGVGTGPEADGDRASTHSNTPKASRTAARAATAAAAATATAVAAAAAAAAATSQETARQVAATHASDNAALVKAAVAKALATA